MNTRKHCLVVDDSDVIRRVTCHLLASLGFNSSEAADGRDALAICRRIMPDAIIVDRSMPGLGGLEFLGRLRGEPDGDKPVVVFCTTENDPDEIARAIAIGADGFLLKPFDLETLRQKLISVDLI